MENSLDANSSSSSWQDVGDILQAFSSISQLSKGKSPNHIVDHFDSRSSRLSPAGSRTQSPLNNGTAGNLRGSSPHEGVMAGRPVGMGRGKYIRELEKKFEKTPEQLDLNIHSELSQIGCGYSNDVIEHNWGYSHSSSACSPIEVSSASDDGNQAKVELIEDNEVGFVESKNNLNGEESEKQEEAALKDSSILQVRNTEQPLVEPVQESAQTTHNNKHRPRKCRNFILLNYSDKNSTPDCALKAPDSFLKSPPKQHSYSNALGSKTTNPVKTQGNSLFSAEDFPAL